MTGYRPDEPLTGRLLVATPTIADDNFARAVVLVVHHDEAGALGVVLNRPGGAPVAEILPTWAPLAADPPVVFVGGPVQREAVLALARTDGDVADLQPVLLGVGLLDLSKDPALVAGEVQGTRLFSGYAGWGEGQLEGEIAVGGWFVVDAVPDDVVTAAPERLWREVLTRQGGVFRTVTDDPSQN